MTFEISGRRIEVVQGDISLQEVDAIVNAANNHLWMGGGVAGAIKRMGGADIEKEALRKGPIAVGESICTSAGNLRARIVIHAAVMGQDLKTDEKKVRDATRSALRVARELNAESVAFPALGTGVGGFQVERAAEIMLRCAIEELESPMTSIELIRFVLFGEAAYDAFSDVAEEIAREFKNREVGD